MTNYHIRLSCENLVKKFLENEAIEYSNYKEYWNLRN